MMNEVRVLFIDHIPTMGVSEFEAILHQRGHRPAAVALFAADGKRVRARVDFATAAECKAARFDLGGFVVAYNGEERRLWAEPFRDGPRRVSVGK